MFRGIVHNVEKAENAMLIDVGGEDGDGRSPAGGQHDGADDVLSEQVCRRQ